MNKSSKIFLNLDMIKYLEVIKEQNIDTLTELAIKMEWFS